MFVHRLGKSRDFGTSRMTALRVGIAGYGVVGKRRGECVKKHPSLELVAVCDQNLHGRNVTDDGIPCYESLDDLLKCELDVLLVSLSNDLAATATAAGLARGMHVFCEKPPARRPSELVPVLELERSNPHLRLMYGFNHRYHDSVIRALDIIRSGELGRIINMRGVYGKAKLITFNQPSWRVEREISGGGVLLDQGIHMVDIMRLFAGDFVEVSSIVSNGHWGYDVEDNAYALMKSKDGAVALFNSSATQWRHQFSLDINLQRGSLILRGILTGSKSYGAETLTIVRADPDNDNGDPIESTETFNRDPSWDREIEAFVNAINSGQAPAHGTSTDALETLQLVYKIYHADPVWRNRYQIETPEIRS